VRKLDPRALTGWLIHPTDFERVLDARGRVLARCRYCNVKDMAPSQMARHRGTVTHSAHAGSHEGGAVAPTLVETPKHNRHSGRSGATDWASPSHSPIPPPLPALYIPDDALPSRSPSPFQTSDSADGFDLHAGFIPPSLAQKRIQLVQERLKAPVPGGLDTRDLDDEDDDGFGTFLSDDAMSELEKRMEELARTPDDVTWHPWPSKGVRVHFYYAYVAVELNTRSDVPDFAHHGHLASSGVRGLSQSLVSMGKSTWCNARSHFLRFQSGPQGRSGGDRR
jgi:hypothetical protein